MDCGEVTWSLKYSFSSDLFLVVYLLSSADSQVSCSATTIFSNSSIDSTWQNPHPDLVLFIQEQLWFFCSKSASHEGAFLLQLELIIWHTCAEKREVVFLVLYRLPLFTLFSSFPQWCGIQWDMHCAG